jgi:hypothetical protein
VARWGIARWPGRSTKRHPLLEANEAINQPGPEALFRAFSFFAAGLLAWRFPLRRAPKSITANLLMPYRPRELAVRAREAAGLLLSTLDREELVPRFLDMYAAEYRRPGRADRPALYHEQLETIRREAILAMVLRAEGMLPRRLKVRVQVRAAKSRKPARRGGRKGKKQRPAKKQKAGSLDLAIPLLDMFREEFFVALGQALNWSNEEAREFWHDLDVCESLSEAESQRQRSRRTPGSGASGPFVDRVALLLDPSLMEQARRVAGKFQLELNSAADRVLRKVFSARRAN